MPYRRFTYWGPVSCTDTALADLSLFVLIDLLCLKMCLQFGKSELALMTQI